MSSFLEYSNSIEEMVGESLDDINMAPDERITKFYNKFYDKYREELPNTFVRCTLADDPSTFKYDDNIVSMSTEVYQFEKVYNFHGLYFFIRVVSLNM